ncbi:sn-glycerol-3-phosphate ABC transporter ATP-binding protein UgpC [Paracoccus sp. (in: a-proteobacteria)]|uniref:ABC transporter ATP-binding protein n=1 Tax=Paracoccus sp. TaxID=267 RepID=UPI0028AC741F|nr:sn-glycerol-3-phosphate ABC transporter ATP-binding protein UgpC [Paracoccus sp. (in: a-proteobacteria)]
MTAIVLNNLRKTFGTLDIIPGLDLEIQPGEFVALVGPSGCGKSTLLRMIAGLESISGGDLNIGGQRVNDTPPKERDIAMVFQSYALYPHMTVADNMAFSLRLRGASASEKRTKVHAAAESLGLTHLLDRFPRELSGGQRQRVAMGRAIVRNPKVFLFDEPLSNLDAKLRVHTRAEIKALHQRLKTTTVYVTHDQVEAMTMADRIIVMNRGHVEQLGSPLELYDRPRNRFVAGFLGSPAMNFIEGNYDPETGLFTVDEGPALPLGKNRWPHSGKATLGLRPEYITVGEAGPQAKVTVIEPTGSETHIRLILGSQAITAVLRTRIDAKVGQDVALNFDIETAHLFDPKTELRLIPHEG